MLATHRGFSLGPAKTISLEWNISTTLVLPQLTPRRDTIGVTIFCHSGTQNHYSGKLSFTHTSTTADCELFLDESIRRLDGWPQKE